MDPTAILNLINIAIPAGLQIFTMIHNRVSGTTTVIVHLDAEVAADNDTVAKIAAWAATHPTLPPVVPPAAAPAVAATVAADFKARALQLVK